MLSEEHIFKEEKLSLMYIKAVDKILRFRLFREQLSFKLEN